ncbi:DUF2169 domain-containing protein [Sorangium sp. So ce119]|uniref:DUF2169 family type VI secretion system accessory protein n=1 Tax=Sorangium sp. So ce119 TaxID=3133279 RepID=UPI003F62E2A4
MEVIVDCRAGHVPVPMKDKHGRDQMVVVLAYTFAVDARGAVEVLDPEEPRLVDEYTGADPAASSLRKPSVLFDYKPGTDVILIGHAHPPATGRHSHVDVSLLVGPLRKTVRAHGLRTWKWGAFGGLAPGPARVIQEPIPLVYELAWGGSDFSDPTQLVGEPRNLVGRGVARQPKSLIDKLAAQLEDPAQPIGAGDNVPACFGAIHRHWEPRARYAGTYDQAWMQRKMPLLPDDFDPRFHVSVPHDQWSATPLRSDEPIEVRGATPEGVWRFQLPRISPGFSSVSRGVRTEHRTHLDSILLDADARRVELTFRAAIPVPRKYEHIDEIFVLEKELV